MTRARLLAAAKEIFEERGLLDARIADITMRAGVSYGSFYHYFDSKEAVFREVAAIVEARLSAPLDDVIFVRGSGSTPEERLHEGISRYFESYREDARLLGVIEQASRFDEEVSALRRAHYRETATQIAASIRQLQRRGMADPELDPKVAATALGAMTYRFAELWLAQGELECDFEAGVDTVARLFVNALGLRR